MKTRLVVALLILLTVVNLSGFGFMAYHRFAPPPPRAWSEGRMRPPDQRDMHLPREQARALRAFRERFREETAGARDSLYDVNMLLMEELRRNPSDSARIDSLLERTDKLQRLMHRRMVYALLHEANMLPPAQRDALMAVVRNQVGRRMPFLFGEQRPPREDGFRGPERKGGRHRSEGLDKER